MTYYSGPCEIDCPLKCKVPRGVILVQVPQPRAMWGDVLDCPNGVDNGEDDRPAVDCDRAFLIKAVEPL